MRSLAIATLVLLGGFLFPSAAAGSWMDSSMGLLQGELTARFGPGQRPRIQRGLAQVARYWQPRDGGAGEFEAFVRAQYAGEPGARDSLFERLESAVASLDGHLREADCFNDKLAFTVLLNFPLTTLQERLRDGGSWTSRQWAEARLAGRFSRRVPAEVAEATERRCACPARPPKAPGADRCQALLQAFRAARLLDPYSPLAPTRINRSDEELQLSEARVGSLLEAVCGSPLAARTASLIRTRLGRGLEPSDLWYDGFRRTRQPARAEAPPLLAGVPAPPFGAALAQVFRDRGLPGPPGRKARAMAALDGFWRAYGWAGAALADTAVWHWLYEHPEAAPADLEAAVAASAREVWNRYYAQVFGRKDSDFLAWGPLNDPALQLPGCPIGQMIASQLQRELDRTGSPGGTFERWTRLGWLTPDLWMVRATGSPLGPEALLDAAAGALQLLEPRSRASCRSGEGKASSP